MSSSSASHGGSRRTGFSPVVEHRPEQGSFLEAVSKQPKQAGQGIAQAGEAEVGPSAVHGADQLAAPLLQPVLQPWGDPPGAARLTSFSRCCLTDGTVGGRHSTCMASGAPHSPIGGALDGGVQHQLQQLLQATRQLLAGAELQIAAGAHRASRAQAAIGSPPPRLSSSSPFPLHEGGAAGQIGAARQVQADVEAEAHDLVAPLQQLQHHRHVLFSRRNTLRWLAASLLRGCSRAMTDPTSWPRNRTRVRSTCSRAPATRADSVVLGLTCSWLWLNCVVMS